MSEFNFEVNGGESLRLKTARKYCDKDIVVRGNGGGGRNPLELLYTEGAEITAEDWGSANVKDYDISGSSVYIRPVHFYGCKFKKATFPNTQVAPIGFVRNYTVEEIDFGDSMAGNERCVEIVRGCESLKKVWFGEDFLPFGNYAFDRCKSLNEVHYAGTIDKWASASRNTNAARANPFFNSGGGSFYLGDSTEPLTEINLTTATTITIGAFGYFTDIEKAIFGEKVATINANAFQGCSKLETLILIGDTVKTLSATNALALTPIADGTGTIYIQPETVDEATLVAEYKAATNWSTYEGQIKPFSEYTGG